MSPTDKPGLPSKEEKTATLNSGIDVETESRMKPIAKVGSPIILAIESVCFITHSLLLNNTIALMKNIKNCHMTLFFRFNVFIANFFTLLCYIKFKAIFLIERQWSSLVKIRASQKLEIACDPGSNPGWRIDSEKLNKKPNITEKNENIRQLIREELLGVFR